MELSWTAPPDCPTGAEVRAQVERMVGTRERRRVVVASTVQKDGDAWSVSLHTQVGEEEGERTMHGATCEEVAQAAVVVIALAIDPDALTPLPPPPPEPSPPPPRAPPPRAPERIGWTTGVHLGAGLGTLPGVAPFVSANAGLELHRFSAQLGGSVFASKEEGAALAGTGGEFDLLTGFIQGCIAPIEAIRACAGVEIDRMHARGFGVTAPSEATAAWIAPRVAVVPTWKPHRAVRLVLPIEASAPLDRPTFVLDGIGAVFRPPAVGLRLALGGELSF